MLIYNVRSVRMVGYRKGNRGIPKGYQNNKLDNCSDNNYNRDNIVSKTKRLIKGLKSMNKSVKGVATVIGGLFLLGIILIVVFAGNPNNYEKKERLIVK